MWEFIVIVFVLAVVFWLKNEMQSNYFKISQQLYDIKSELTKIRGEKSNSGPTDYKIATNPKIDLVSPIPTSQTAPEIILELEDIPTVQEEIQSDSSFGTDEHPINLLEELGIPQRKPKPVEEEKQLELETTVKLDTPLSENPTNISPDWKPKSKGFFESHPDMEKFIGENLINKIGIAILVLGIAFFVKYAIDKDWINEIGRTCIGLFAGGILIGIAHRLRKSYKAFSSVLIGGGLAVLYFTITISFQQYHLFSQTAAFAIMVVITAFAVLLSIAYDRMELAVLAIIGGFGTPFMVSTGEGNFAVLFTYLMILNMGMLILAFRKKWNLVNIVCFAFTIILYGSWLVTKCLNQPHAPYFGALFFGTLFYITFFLMNILYNINKQEKFKPLEFSILLSNTALYFGAGISILHFLYQGLYQGLFTALLAVFNFAFAYPLYKKQTVDRNLVYLLIGLVLTFLSLAAPVQLDGNYITMFWSAEAVLLLWLAQKSQIKLIKIASIIVLGLMVFSLLMDWQNLYGNHNNKLEIILNKAFITSLVSLTSVFLVWRLLNNETEDFFIDRNFPLIWYKIILMVVVTGILYGALGLELNYQLIEKVDFVQSRNLVLACYNFSFVAAIIWFARTNDNLTFVNIKAMLAAVCLVSYLLAANNSIIEVRNHYLSQTATAGLFYYIHFYLAAVIIYLSLQLRNLCTQVSSELSKIMEWLTIFLLVFIASAELDHIITVIAFSTGSDINHIVNQNHKIGFPVLWGVFSFVLMQQGMKNKSRLLRIISLTLFAITILKLFVYDIRDVSEGGKIIAFIALGVLLLIVSFMYQRLKNLILDDEKKTATAQNEETNDTTL